ncbi:hypothetical protein FAIPA1_140083 [Frankia sp. AiPs1]
MGCPTMPPPSPSAPVALRSAIPLPTSDPPPPSPPLRVATDRPRNTFVSLLQGYEGTNGTPYPVEATPRAPTAGPGPGADMAGPRLVAASRSLR